MNALAQALLRQAWPGPDLDLLLRTALLPDAEAAEAWRRFKARRDVEAVTWEEHRLLAPIAPRLARIAPNCPFRPRIEGLAKAHWTTSQLMLRASAAALDELTAAGIPVMLMKGGALQAAGLGGRGPRISGDLDVLVPRSLFPEAVSRLFSAGWRSRDSVDFARAYWRFGSGINLRHPPNGDLDVHHQPIAQPRLSDALLDAFWRRARPAVFHRRAVLVPSPEDMIVLTAAHGVRPAARREASAAWVLNLVRLVERDAIAPTRVAEIAADFGATAACLSSLSYLQSLMPLPGTARLIAELASPGPTFRQLLGLYAMTGVRSSWAVLPRELARLFAGQPGPRFEREREGVPRLRRLRLRPDRGTELDCPSRLGERRLRHEFTVSAGAARRLFLRLEFDRPDVLRRYRFDVAVDGVPVARLGARLPSAGAVKATATTFAVPLPPGRGPNRTLAVEALGERDLPPGATTAQVLRGQAIPFRILRLARD